MNNNNSDKSIHLEQYISQYAADLKSAKNLFTDKCWLVAEQKICMGLAHQTPKKIGQFFIFYQYCNKKTVSFKDNEVDYLVVVYKEQSSEYIENNSHPDKTRHGYFIFNTEILIKQGILATAEQRGKWAFRVYAPWCKTDSYQAIKTQKWQCEYFYHYPECITILSNIISSK